MQTQIWAKVIQIWKFEIWSLRNTSQVIHVGKQKPPCRPKELCTECLADQVFSQLYGKLHGWYADGATEWEYLWVEGMKCFVWELVRNLKVVVLQFWNLGWYVELEWPWSGWDTDIMPDNRLQSMLHNVSQRDQRNRHRKTENVFM